MNRKQQTNEPILDILRDPIKRRAWVIYQLSLKGESLAGIARTLGVTRGAVYHVFKAPYPKMEKALAVALGMEPSALFPERYDASGKPNRPRGNTQKHPNKSRKNTAPKPGRKGKQDKP